MQVINRAAWSLIKDQVKESFHGVGAEIFSSIFPWLTGSLRLPALNFIQSAHLGSYGWQLDDGFSWLAACLSRLQLWLVSTYIMINKFTRNHSMASAPATCQSRSVAMTISSRKAREECGFPGRIVDLENTFHNASSGVLRIRYL
jgi:hypothetical protein